MLILRVNSASANFSIFSAFNIRRNLLTFPRKYSLSLQISNGFCTRWSISRATVATAVIKYHLTHIGYFSRCRWVHWSILFQTRLRCDFWFFFFAYVMRSEKSYTNVKKIDFNASFTFSLRQHETRWKREYEGYIRLIFHTLDLLSCRLEALKDMSVNQSRVKGNENVSNISP